MMRLCMDRDFEKSRSGSTWNNNNQLFSQHFYIVEEDVVAESPI